MPIYEFCCDACGFEFEEIISINADAPACPKCGSKNTGRKVSVPSPLKKGAFPFKVSPPRPQAKPARSGNK